MSSSSSKHPESGDPPTSPPAQRWTPDGHPIVDGKYHDLATDETKTHEGRSCPGPPSLKVYWNNCGPIVQENQFFAKGCWSRLSVTEYLTRLGGMLGEKKVKICSLNATQYAVFVVVEAGLSNEEFGRLLCQYGLGAGPGA